MSRQFHQFSIELASAYGINGATILENLIHLQLNHEYAGDEGFYFEGRWWVRHTPDSLADWHPYWTARSIRHTLDKLVEQGAVVRASDPKNKSDRTSYWSVNRAVIDSLNLANANDKNGKALTKTADVLHNNNIKTNLSRAPRSKKPNPPDSLDTVRAYCVEKNLEVDPIRFWNWGVEGDWHDSNGKPILNWKQKLITWSSYGEPRRQVTREGSTRTRDISILEQLTDTSWAN